MLWTALPWEELQLGFLISGEFRQKENLDWELVSCASNKVPIPILTFFWTFITSPFFPLPVWILWCLVQGLHATYFLSVQAFRSAFSSTLLRKQKACHKTNLSLMILYRCCWCRSLIWKRNRHKILFWGYFCLFEIQWLLKRSLDIPRWGQR